MTDDRTPRRALRILVTGFNDWEALGSPPNVWRCRDNPSCRLLTGGESDHPPSTLEGPLVQRLTALLPKYEVAYRTLPVTWGAFSGVPEGIDIIVNLGLGVYDRDDVLQLERGAFNRRRGRDAAGRELDEPIEAGAPSIRAAPDHVTRRVASIEGQTFGRYTLRVTDARESNSYLCNETHWSALNTVDSGRTTAAYFLHIPRAVAGDYDALAEGIAGVIVALASA